LYSTSFKLVFSQGVRLLKKAAELP
jgi:hypothetical protein